MTTTQRRPGPTGVPVLDDVVAEATGHEFRADPVRPRTGGPAGNARLTAWTGLALLVLIGAEFVTLLNVTGMLDWHTGLGVGLVGFALLKTATTGWRVLRYYTGSPAYRTAGPPPLLLRLLGPLVVLCTLGVLGSGLALIAIGGRASQDQWFAVLGQRISPITVHQGFFILFAIFAGLHLCARFIPALIRAAGPRRSSTSSGVPGRSARTAVLAAIAVASALAAVLLLPAAHGWHGGHHHRVHVHAGLSR